MKLSKRIDQCPCCQESDFSTVFINHNPIDITKWQEFFYGSSRFIKNLYRCNNCNYQFINDITANYENYYKEQNLAESESLDPSRIKYFKEVKRQLHATYPTLSQNPTILDIGCSKGLWLSLWTNNGNLFGSEYSTECMAPLKQRGIKVLNQVEIAERKFDIISLMDVLEHIEEPFLLLQTITKSLSSDGILVIGVPDMGKLLAKLFKHKYYLVCPMHFSYFNETAIELLLSRLFPLEHIYIEKSPIMNTDLKGVSRWLSFIPEVSDKFNITIPVPYRASILCFASKKIQHNTNLFYN